MKQKPQKPIKIKSKVENIFPYGDCLVPIIPKNKKLSEETNLKFIRRVENMLYNICGCDKKIAEIILKECLKRNKERKY